MTSRVQLIREAFNLSREDFAAKLGVHIEYVFMAENALDPNDIPDFIIEKIETLYHVSRKFILGYPYTVRKPVNAWHADERKDYQNATNALKKVLTAHFGYCEFSDPEPDSDRTP